MRKTFTYLPYYNVRYIPKVCHEHANSTDFTQLINDFTVFFLYYYGKNALQKVKI